MKKLVTIQAKKKRKRFSLKNKFETIDNGYCKVILVWNVIDR